MSFNLTGSSCQYLIFQLSNALSVSKSLQPTGSELDIPAKRCNKSLCASCPWLIAPLSHEAVKPSMGKYKYSKLRPSNDKKFQGHTPNKRKTSRYV